MHVLDFSTELQNAEVSLTLIKSDSTTDALPAILKFLTIFQSFWCSYFKRPDVVLQVIVKNIMFKSRSYGLQLY